MAKDDLKISMSTVIGPDDRVDRTISYVNGNVDNSVLSSLASQLVGLTTNTYISGEKIQRIDISEPDSGGGTLELTGRIDDVLKGFNSLSASLGSNENGDFILLDINSGVNQVRIYYEIV